jgi:hypothetical protein
MVTAIGSPRDDAGEPWPQVLSRAAELEPWTKVGSSAVAWSLQIQIEPAKRTSGTHRAIYHRDKEFQQFGTRRVASPSSGIVLGRQANCSYSAVTRTEQCDPAPVSGYPF